MHTHEYYSLGSNKTKEIKKNLDNMHNKYKGILN